jgi:hypothetical protein
MVYLRMPGSVPSAYVKATLKRDAAGDVYAVLVGQKAEQVPAEQLSVAYALEVGRSTALRSGVEFYVEAREEDWDADAFGPLHDAFLAR